jgi:hypothetical protein
MTHSVIIDVVGYVPIMEKMGPNTATLIAGLVGGGCTLLAGIATVWVVYHQIRLSTKAIVNEIQRKHREDTYSEVARLCQQTIYYLDDVWVQVDPKLSREATEAQRSNLPFYDRVTASRDAVMVHNAKLGDSYLHQQLNALFSHWEETKAIMPKTGFALPLCNPNQIEYRILLVKEGLKSLRSYALQQSPMMYSR